jgi:hypothetical protein
VTHDRGVVAAALVITGLAGVWVAGVGALSDLRVRDDVWDGLGFRLAGTWACIAAVVAGIAAIGLVRARARRRLAWLPTAAAVVVPLTYVGVGVALGGLPALPEVGVPAIIVVAALAAWQLLSVPGPEPRREPGRAGRAGAVVCAALAVLGLWGVTMGVVALVGGLRTDEVELTSLHGAVDRWLGLSAVVLAGTLLVLAVGCGQALWRGHGLAAAGSVVVGVMLAVGLLVGLGTGVALGGVDLPAVVLVQLRLVLAAAVALVVCGVAVPLDGRPSR